jgi:aldehyde dehydrogenase (NAD+)
MFDELLSRLWLDGVQSGAAHGARIEQPGGEVIESINPSTGRVLGRVRAASGDDYSRIAEAARQAFGEWRDVPPPGRGELVRRIGQALRDHKRDLGLLITLETGKIRSEGEGEVQEMIDMCDLAVGLSRQLYGRTIASERVQHRMIEQWHPLGPVGVITAFNFPAAVWAWNALVAAVCGDTVVWKPSPLAPLTAVAVHRIVSEVARAGGYPDVFHLCVGGEKIG